MNIDIIPGTQLKIKQNRNEFSYGIDAILLSDFVKPKGKIIDLGTGTGIIPLRLIGKFNDKIEKIYGVEIQKKVYDLAKSNIKLNKLEDKIKIKNINIKDIDKHFSKSNFNVVVSNPPYMKKDGALINKDKNFAISRHEIECTIEDIIKAADYLLEPRGELYLVHRPNRLVDIFYYMRKYRIEPKEIRFVKPKEDKKTNLVLIKGIKHSNPELTIKESLVVYEDSGEYREEIYEIYGSGWREDEK